ncbi:MAG: hypothetical protein ABID61_05480 [Candidatus Micrarchaeota archaeon]
MVEKPLLEFEGETFRRSITLKETITGFISAPFLVQLYHIAEFVFLFGLLFFGLFLLVLAFVFHICLIFPAFLVLFVSLGNITWKIISYFIALQSRRSVSKYIKYTIFKEKICYKPVYESSAFGKLGKWFNTNYLSHFVIFRYEVEFSDVIKTNIEKIDEWTTTLTLKLRPGAQSPMKGSKLDLVSIYLPKENMEKIIKKIRDLVLKNGGKI